ncbi:D-3-phosphoglycerate dehydrogenase, chloroplastic [Triticum urartu]|uniref:D-3-phosphoglycerate dehydrogenase, chloroplastic n=1 Tax=Triticum urartu TaxID=4572 RepID=M7Z3W4_TRIUA|nr:D-3-phosphoglycerate dehydrogenase, chloroplastic [Triticum urartu]
MGFGKVGSEVARRAKGLGMHVIAHDPYAPVDKARAIGAELVSFEEAIAKADFISLHMPLTPATSKVFNDESFGKMKTGVRIVNVARGGVIDEDALVRALDSSKVAQVMSELAPYVSLAEKLGRLAVQLVAGESGIKGVKVVYTSARDPDDLDTRLLRAMAIMAIGVDEEPDKKTLEKIGAIPAVEEFVFLEL